MSNRQQRRFAERQALKPQPPAPGEVRYVHLQLKGWRVEIGGTIWVGRDAKPIYFVSKQQAENTFNKYTEEVEKAMKLKAEEIRAKAIELRQSTFKCPDHPRYKGKSAPKNGCEGCMKLHEMVAKLAA